jgi:hypothetical protein
MPPSPALSDDALTPRARARQADPTSTLRRSAADVTIASTTACTRAPSWNEGTAGRPSWIAVMNSAF